MSEERRSPNEVRKTQDARTDSAIGAAIDTGAAAATALAAAKYPELAFQFAATGALVPHILKAALQYVTGLGNRFFETLEKDAAAAGFTAEQLRATRSVEEEAAQAFHAAYQNVMQACDPRAATALAHLVAQVLFHDHPRDAFFRDAGRVFSEADAEEWDSVVALVATLRAPTGEVPDDVTPDYYRLDDATEKRVRLSLGFQRDPERGRAWLVPSPTPIRPALQLMARHGLATRRDSAMGWSGGEVPPEYRVSIEHATRLKALIREGEG